MNRFIMNRTGLFTSFFAMLFFPVLCSMGQITPKVIKADFIVNSFGGDYGADQVGPNMATDSSGNYAVTWMDMRSGKKEVYAQFFDRNDRPVGGNIRVSEKPYDWNMEPAIACNKKGDFIIVWAQNSYKLLGQRFSKDGNKIGKNFQINVKAGYFYSYKPSVAVNDNGYFLVFWDMQYVYTESMLYARIFDPYGNPLTDDLSIGEQAGKGSSSSGWGSRAATDGQNNFAVVWSQSQPNSTLSEIYIQRINISGQKVGGNVILSSLNDSTNQYYPSIAALDNGTYLISWEHDRNSGYPTYGVSARLYNVQGNFITDPIALFENTVTWHRTSLSSDRKNSFIFTWYAGSEVLCQKIQADGKLSGTASSIKFNSNFPLYNVLPITSDIINNTFYVTFNYFRNNDQNCYIQKFSTDYTPLGSLKKINDDQGSAWQGKPVTGFNGQGGYIVLWEDRRNGWLDLYGQVYDSRNNPVGSNIQINDGLPGENSWYLKEKAVKALSDGTFVIAFTGSPDYSYTNVYLQAISPFGEKIRKNVAVSEGNGYGEEFKIALNADKNDNVLISWYRNSYDAGSVFLKEYNKDLQTLSAKNQVDYGEIKGLSKVNPSVSINKNLKVLLSWRYNDYSKGYLSNKINGGVFDYRGLAVSKEMVLDSVNNEEGYSVDFQNCLSEDNDKDYALVWRSGNGTHVKRYYYVDQPVSFSDVLPAYYFELPKILAFRNRKLFISIVVDNYTNKSVNSYYFNDNHSESRIYKLYQFDSSSVSGYESHYINSAAILDNRLIFAYESFRNGVTGFDVWAKVLDLDNISFKPEKFLTPVNNDVLYPNVPNPFNSTTKISYQVYSYHKVRLSIYDILGREVKVLVDENQEKGYYEVNFDAAGLASGIYLCRLEAFNTFVNKMILIK